MLYRQMGGFCPRRDGRGLTLPAPSVDNVSTGAETLPAAVRLLTFMGEEDIRTGFLNQVRIGGALSWYRGVALGRWIHGGSSRWRRTVPLFETTRARDLSFVNVGAQHGAAAEKPGMSVAGVRTT